MWKQYSRKLRESILHPRSLGSIVNAPNGMRVVKGIEGCVEDGNIVTLYLLVDEEQGMIADCKYQCYGESALVGALEVLSEIALRKNVNQARRLTTELVDKHVRDKNEVPAFPEASYPHLNIALAALDEALAYCFDIQCDDEKIESPLHFDALEGGELPDWESFTEKERLSLIGQVIKADIQPYIELDEGGIEIVRLEGVVVVIRYSGACTSCYAATGSTLSAIQGILRQKVNPLIVVKPLL
jgi:NifU-like protein